MNTKTQPVASEPCREDRMVVLKRDEHGKPTVWCDPEIADLVGALNSNGIATVASCSGHGGQFGNIALQDGRELLVLSDFESVRKAEKAIASEPSSGERSKSQMLADRLDSSDPDFDDCTEAAIELRRLHALTGELSRVLSAPVFNHALALDVIRQAAALLSSDAKPASEPVAPYDFINLMPPVVPTLYEPGQPISEPNSEDLETIIDNHLDGYELRGDEGDHTPTEFERLLIKDAILGLLVDEDWDKAWGAHIKSIATSEPVAVPQDVLSALDRMCTPLHESRLSGATAEADARCMKLIRDYVISTAPSPAPVGIKKENHDI